MSVYEAKTNWAALMDQHDADRARRMVAVELEACQECFEIGHSRAAHCDICKVLKPLTWNDRPWRSDYCPKCEAENG